MSSPIPRRATVGWILYDLANTVFAMGVVSTTFPLWVRDQVGVNQADRVHGLVTSLSMMLIFVLSPLVGAMTDRARRRLPFLVVSTLACVLCTSSLGRFGVFATMLAYVLGNAFYQAGLQFYDSLLPAVSTPENRGRIGGLGVGIGYFGSFLALALTGLAAARGWGRETVFLALALAFLAFAWPCFVFVTEPVNPRPNSVWGFGAIIAGLRSTLLALRDTEAHPGLLRFLIGRIFYTDAINTVIATMTLFAVNVTVRAGHAPKEAEGQARLVMLLAVVFAIVGGILWGRLVDRHGPRRVLGWVLGVWLVTLLLGALLGWLAMPMAVLFVVGILAGLALGGTWAADRPLMLELTPPERLGEFYGLYGMVGRFAAVIGPLLWSGLTAAAIALGMSPLRAQGLAIAALLLLVLVGRQILRPLLAAPLFQPSL